MSKPTPLKALKFFKEKFPSATWMDAALIVGSMRMINTLSGAYLNARMDKLEAEKGELPAEAFKKEHDRFEQTFGPQSEVYDIMEHFFGVDKREYDFDPAQLSDYLNHSPTADKMFGKQKMKEIITQLSGKKPNPGGLCKAKKHGLDYQNKDAPCDLCAREKKLKEKKRK